jgi:hypothetical protein
LTRATQGVTELDPDEYALVQSHVAIDRAQWMVEKGQISGRVEDQLSRIVGDWANEILDTVNELYERRERKRSGTSPSA